MNTLACAPRRSAPFVIALALIVALLAHPASAAAPQCYTYSGGAYCQYDGKVNRAYINAYGQVLLYFDTPMAPGVPGSVGISGVSIGEAAIYPVSENPDFAKALYATLLSAQARGATVQVQMFGSNAGYLKMDRVWILEN
jgi:hypothetical protein